MFKSTHSNWQSWLKSPLGQYMIAWEQQQLNQLVCDIFGHHALQMSMPELDALKENRMPMKTLALSTIQDLPVDETKNHIFCDKHQLPFANESTDLIILPHALEFTEHPHQLLREAYRILAPEGKLVLTGFNSLSLWGFKQTLSRHFKHPFIPEMKQPLAFIRIKDWLKLLGFDLESGRFGCYRPPFKTEKWIKRMAFMESAGDRWWPIFGALYTVTAVKHVHSLTLVGKIKLKKNLLSKSLQTQTAPQRKRDIST